MLAKDDFLLLQSGLDPKKGGNGEESGQQPSALTIPHDPPRNGVLSSDPWQKIRKTAANGTAPASSPCGLWLLIGAFRLVPLRGRNWPNRKQHCPTKLGPSLQPKPPGPLGWH